MSTSETSPKPPEAKESIGDDVLGAFGMCLGVGALIFLFIVGVRMGAALDYHGLSAWLVVVAFAGAWAVTRMQFVCDGLGVDLAPVRPWALTLTIVMAVTTFAASGTREDSARQGEVDRFIAAILQNPGKAEILLRQAPEDMLDHAKPVLGKPVTAELQRRRTEEADQAAAHIAKRQRDLQEANERKRAFEQSPVGKLVMLIAGIITIVGGIKGP